MLAFEKVTKSVVEWSDEYNCFIERHVDITDGEELANVNKQTKNYQQRMLKASCRHHRETIKDWDNSYNRVVERPVLEEEDEDESDEKKLEKVRNLNGGYRMF